MTDEKQPSLKTDVLFALISLGSTSVWTIASGWLLYFYLPPQGEGVTRAPAAFYGVTILLTRVINAALTIPIGQWSDRTRSRWGRRVPFMAASALPMLACFVLLWFPPVAGQSVWNLVYLAAVLLLYNLAYTVNQVPYMAWLPELAVTDRHRVRMSAWSSSLFLVGLILGGLAGWLIEGVGYGGMALIYAAVSIPLFYVPLALLRERSQSAVGIVPARLNLRETAQSLLRNHPFVIMTATGLCYWGITTMIQSAIPFIATEICGMGQADTMWLYIPGVLTSLACYPLLTWLVGRVGKWAVFAGSLLMSAMVLPGLFLIGEWLPLPMPWQGVIWIVLQAIAISGVAMLPAAFGGEIVDHDAELTGQRREGLYYAVWGLCDQAVNGVVAALLPLLLLLGRSRLDAHGPLGVRLIGVMGGVLMLAGFVIFGAYPFKHRQGRQADGC